MLKATEQMKNRIAEVIEERAKETALREQQLADAKKKLQEAEDALTAAIDNDDTKAYSKAKAEKASAEDELELRTKRLDQLKGSELITEQEYNRRCKLVFDELKALDAEQWQKVIQIVSELKTIYDRITTEIEEANNALRQWQHDLYRDKDRMKNIHGHTISGVDIKRYENFDITTFILNIQNDGFYKGALQQFAPEGQEGAQG